MLVYVSRGIPATRKPVDTFTFVARPLPQSDRDVDCFTITGYRHYEIESPTPFLKSDLPDGVVAYIERHYDIAPPEIDSRTYLEKACSAASIKGVETKRATPSTLLPGKNKLQEARYNQHATMEATPSTLLPGKNKLQEAQYNRIATMEATPSTLLPGKNKLQEARYNQHATMEATPSILLPGKNKLQEARYKQDETLGAEGQAKRIKKMNETLGAEGRAKRRKKQEDTLGVEGKAKRYKNQLETTGVEGQLDKADARKATHQRNGGKQCRIIPYPRSHPQMIVLEGMIVAYQKEHTARKDLARMRVVTKLRSDLCGGYDAACLAKINWDDRLPLDFKELLSDEQNYVGVKILLGEIRLK